MQGLNSLSNELSQLKKKVANVEARIESAKKEPTVVVKKGDPGDPGRPGKDVKLEDVVDSLRPDVFRRFQQGMPSGNMNRNIVINSSVLSYYGDLNYLGSIAGIPNHTTKQTDVFFSGGGSPGSPDTSVQFNSGGTFAGSTNFKYITGSNRILLGVEGGLGQIVAPDAASANTNGSGLDFFSGVGTNGNAGGLIRIVAGDGGPTGGANGIQFQGGSGGATSGPGGNLSFTAGSAQAGDSNGGDVTLSSGSGTGVNRAGNVTISTAGFPDAGTAGNIILSPGQNNSENVFGYVRIKRPNANISAILDPGTVATTDKTFTFPNLTATLGVQSATVNAASFTSGTYTPTRSAEANLDANVTMSEAQYMRVGNTVTVSGRFTADPTLTATATSFEIILPVASNIGAVEDAAGTAFCGAIAGMGGEVIGVVANDTAKIQWVASDVTSKTWSYLFTYQII